MTSSSDCAFCAIAAGKADANMVYADDAVMAFLPLNPATRGHTLVVPRRHFPDFFSLTEPTALELGRVTKAVAESVRAVMDSDGMNLITSAGAAAQQTVFHLHVHVLPRYDGDRVGDIWPADQPMSSSETESVRARIENSVQEWADAKSAPSSPPRRSR